MKSKIRVCLVGRNHTGKTIASLNMAYEITKDLNKIFVITGNGSNSRSGDFTKAYKIQTLSFLDYFSNGMDIEMYMNPRKYSIMFEELNKRLKEDDVLIIDNLDDISYSNNSCANEWRRCRNIEDAGYVYLNRTDYIQTQKVRKMLIEENEYYKRKLKKLISSLKCHVIINVSIESDNLWYNNEYKKIKFLQNNFMMFKLNNNFIGEIDKENKIDINDFYKTLDTNLKILFKKWLEGNVWENIYLKEGNKNDF